MLLKMILSSAKAIVCLEHIFEFLVIKISKLITFLFADLSLVSPLKAKKISLKVST